MIVVAASLALAIGAQAASLVGKVIGVADGDTITVLDAERVQHKVRLAGIDAPESRQAYGTRSRQNLSSLVYRQQVNVEWYKRDRYGRLVGVVRVEGADVNLAQIALGLAWWYREYQSEQAPADRARYAEAERGAQAQQLGLWADAAPIPPWEWRRARR